MTHTDTSSHAAAESPAPLRFDIFEPTVDAATQTGDRPSVASGVAQRVPDPVHMQTEAQTTCATPSPTLDEHVGDQVVAALRNLTCVLNQANERIEATVSEPDDQADDIRTAHFRIRPGTSLGPLIGEKGAYMRHIRSDSGALVQLDRAGFRVSGRASQIDRAVQLIISLCESQMVELHADDGTMLVDAHGIVHAC